MEMRMPGIRYKQGNRAMYVTAGSPQALVKVIEAPRMYDPRRPQEQGNRALDKSHLAGIVRYLEQAQDFVDLQRNVKPLSSSLGAALDRRWSVNRFAMDLAKNVGLLKAEADGDRIEYLSPNLSKLSPKLYTFASWRFAMGTLLIGFG